MAGLFAAAVAGCGGGSEAPSPAPAPPDTATFVFRLRGIPVQEEFRVVSSSPAFIAQVRAQLALPEAQRTRFVAGPIRAGSAGQNPGWSWHFADASLVESSIELCDGKPSFVEADLDYWLNKVGSFCPWSSYAHAEI
jgi:hypothetical protein